MAARLGATARHLRQQHDFRLIDVAVEAGVSEATVHNFERGRRWRRDTDAIVAAYARLAGVDAEDVWRSALEHPDPPPNDSGSL